jgi:3-oxoadipate enol-lactonase
VTAVELNHRIDGPADAPWLVLSNSLGGSMEMWERNLPALTERFRVLRYDQRGHGGSPVPPGPYTIDDFGRDVVALMDRVGIERAHFCGVSLGGMTAMWLGINAADRIDRLVPACTAPHLGPRSMWDERIAVVESEGMAPLADPTMERWLTPDAPEEIVELLRAMLVATPADGYAAGCAAVRDLDLRPGLGQIRAPTLVIAADQDLSTPPEHGEKIATGIPGARLELLHRGRHLANVERTEAFDRALLEHLSAAG